MNFLVALFVVGWVAIVQGGELKEETKAKYAVYKKNCCETTKVDPTLVEKLIGGEYTDDQKLKEFLACFYKKAGYFSEDGTFQKDAVRDIINEAHGNEVAEKIIKACGDKVEKTVEETAFAISKCWYENKPQK